MDSSANQARTTERKNVRKAKSAARRAYYRAEGKYLDMLEAANHEDSDGEEATDGGEAEESFEASFQRELATLKGSNADSEAVQFQALTTNMDCVIPFRIAKDIDVVALVLRILRDVQETKLAKTRYTLRMIPLIATTKANMDSLETLAKAVLQPHFHQSSQQSRTYAITFAARNCSGLMRDEVIRRVAALVGSHHKVDLERPELTVMVEAFQHVVGMSVVPDYQRLSRFNLVALVDPASLRNEAKTDAKRKRVAGSEDAEAPAKEAATVQDSLAQNQL